jgi:AcrR family transcriptional regulator
LYEYFDSKEAILEALCLQIDEMLGAYLDQTDPSLEPAAGLVEIGMRYIAFARDNPREYQLLRLRRPIAVDDRQGELSGSYAILTNAVRRLVAQSALGAQPAPLDVAGFAYACWSFVHGLATLQNHLGSATELDFVRVQRAALRRFIEAGDGDS